ncbi:hypothetical protein CAPTEDRAFT_182291 [Capitella teleta]|uniref:Transketolase-like pyrimidine-binding domain-containing protein n=1 Tax=Capitella teleta TaxID=283909 RepID=R7TK32_CAPTE|nr:hypothetical protein CAPTEDRAFT_182291 [Capitella teleta]|eukprot:ELT94079.1 hypothetical protein CAPTEDRAFT_182291 [Capitella teleta]
MSALLCLKSRYSALLRCGRAVTSVQQNYHADQGIYGFKPRQSSDFTVSENVLNNRSKNSNLVRLVQAYRKHGHQKASTDPLGLKQPAAPLELDPSWYGLSATDSSVHNLQGILSTGHNEANTAQVIDLLENTYCGAMATEFQHISSLEAREWFAENFESIQQQSLTQGEQIHLAQVMLKSQAFDIFLANKFPTVKRYGGEGAESALGFYDELFRLAAADGISDVIMCIAHRGRLNLLTCLLQYPPVEMFRKMKGKREFPDDVVGNGDVLSHLFASVDLQYDENNVHVTMSPCPSHLESVNAVCAGKTRARAQYKRTGDYAPAEQTDARVGDDQLCFQIHGDAAFSGQGIVMELLAMAEVPHYSVGGTIHLIVNNQIGFTTPNERAKSSENASDIGKMTDTPVIRVNGDHPEEVIKACKLALAYRQKFRKDVIVDYICFRRWGHNEMDDPSFTNPIMYKAIKNRQSIPDLYAKQLIDSGVCQEEELTNVVKEWNAELSSHLTQIESYVPKAYHLERQWSGYIQAPQHISRWDTGVPADILRYVGAKSVSTPEDFPTHPHLVKTHVDRRLQKMQTGSDLDWATAEALAMGSLLYQGYNVRISGQDVGRGTFSHRHCMLVDSETGHAYIPLNNLKDSQEAFLEVGNSILSEEAVLGFEYGFSIDNPKVLAIWEAQFGDFFNGAQIMIDTLVSGGETKWLTQSGLVMLLPHGYDGAGPEHTTCRIERFLQLTDSSETSVDGENINLQFANPTTPAQYFHLLRRQMLRNFRKPLVIAAPKVMLRHPSCVSSLADMAPGSTFEPVISDLSVDAGSVKKVLLVSGKHYFALMNERETRGLKDTAIVRLEALCPFPAAEIQSALSKFTNAQEFVWSQEEHRNQGAWSFVNPRFENILGVKLQYAGRDVAPTPATGVGEIHQLEVKQILDAAFL